MLGGEEAPDLLLTDVVLGAGMNGIDLAEAAGYAGPYTLIFDSEVPVNEWDGLALERDFVLERVGGA